MNTKVPDRIVVSSVCHPAGAGLRYQLELRQSAGGERRVETIFFEVTGAFVPPAVRRLDFAALACIFFAMRAGADLHIDGVVSAELLANLEEFQDAWCKWRPHLYSRVKLSAREEVPCSGRQDGGRRAVAAFSGGVDATFTVVRHVKGLAGRRNVDIAGAVLVHGFDIGVDAHASYDRARENAEAMLASLDVPLGCIRTDWRRIGRFWENEFGAGLAACLSLYAGTAPVGLLGSDEDYGHFVVPWGSNPVTNSLLSSGDFQVMTDGGGYTRTEKVALIARYGDVSSRLRVCWEGPQTGGNCGKCEKCLRTRLNFLAAGANPPASLGGRPSLLEMLSLQARNRVQLAYLEDIVTCAGQQQNPLVAVWKLRLVMQKNRLILFWFPWLLRFPVVDVFRRVCRKVKSYVLGDKRRA